MSWTLSVGGHHSDPATEAAIREACRSAVEDLVAEFGTAVVWSSFSGTSPWGVGSTDDPSANQVSIVPEL